MGLLQPLPDVEGPKLSAFTDDLSKHNVEFLEILGGDPMATLDGIVMKVRIDGKIYALKVVSYSS